MFALSQLPLELVSFSHTAWRTLTYLLTFLCQRKNIFPTGLGASPCTKPIWDSSESSSQAEPFITNRPCSPSTPNVHCHRVHSIYYLSHLMQCSISFPITHIRCSTTRLYYSTVCPESTRTCSTH